MTNSHERCSAGSAELLKEANEHLSFLSNLPGVHPHRIARIRDALNGVAQGSLDTEAIHQMIYRRVYNAVQHILGEQHLTGTIWLATQQAAEDITKSQAKEPEASGGLCAVAPHAVRVGEASADLPTTSEFMDVTAGRDRQPLHSSSADNVALADRIASYLQFPHGPTSWELLVEAEKALRVGAIPQTSGKREDIARIVDPMALWHVSGVDYDRKAAAYEKADAIIALGAR